MKGGSMDRSFLANSPVSSPGQAQLSTHGQMICNSIREFQSLILKWNLQILAGNKILHEISERAKNSWEKDEIIAQKSYEYKLHSCCEVLNLVIMELEGIVKEMGKIKDKLFAIAKLEEYQQQRSGIGLSEIKPLFFAWPVRYFGEVANEIVEAYDKEFKVKNCVAEYLAHCTDENTLTFHKLAWSYHIYTSQGFQLDALLTETGQQG